MEQRFIKIDVPFIDKIYGLIMIKLLDLKTVCTSMIKLTRNTEFLDMTNNSSEPNIFSKDEAIGVVDLRSIGYQKVKPNYEFKPLQVLCNEFNKLTNTLKRNNNILIHILS